MKRLGSMNILENTEYMYLSSLSCWLCNTCVSHQYLFARTHAQHKKTSVLLLVIKYKFKEKKIPPIAEYVSVMSRICYYSRMASTALSNAIIPGHLISIHLCKAEIFTGSGLQCPTFNI